MQMGQRTGEPRENPGVAAVPANVHHVKTSPANNVSPCGMWDRNEDLRSMGGAEECRWGRERKSPEKTPHRGSARNIRHLRTPGGGKACWYHLRECTHSLIGWRVDCRALIGEWRSGMLLGRTAILSTCSAERHRLVLFPLAKIRGLNPVRLGGGEQSSRSVTAVPDSEELWASVSERSRGKKEASPECSLYREQPLLNVGSFRRVPRSFYLVHVETGRQEVEDGGPSEDSVDDDGADVPPQCVVPSRPRDARRLIRLRSDGAPQLVVLLLPLHAAVLEPYLDLALGQAERVRDLDAAPPGQVPVVVELLLQLQRLEARVRLAGSLVLLWRACGKHRNIRRENHLGTPSAGDKSIYKYHTIDKHTQAEWSDGSFDVGAAASQVRFLVGSPPDFCMWGSCRTMPPLIDGLPRGSPVPPPLHSVAAPYSPRFTLIGSQELGVKGRPTLFILTQSLFFKSKSAHSLIGFAKFWKHASCLIGYCELWNIPYWLS
ncbi:hypothetical protein PR048_007946 [Dryococelus australis]|uniref:Uncharacterized protein n=1 Tax=Dryococelus australis TaxID=614101 RepID=A0ABQ9HWI8_9NEOP|nr:hypothetical protein PR048_007946 [Dryococelus australis]